FRNALDLGEVVALIAKARSDQLFGIGNERLRERFAFFDQHKFAQFLFRQNDVAGEIDFAELIFAAFVDVEADVNLLAVGRQRHLRGFDAEIDVAAIEIIRIQFFDIALEFFLGVFVVAGQPRPPPGRLELEQLDQGFIIEYRITDDIDVFDLGGFALFDTDANRDTIARLRDHFRLDVRVVTALRGIGAPQLLAHLLQCRAFEYLAFAESGLLEVLGQIFGFKLFVAFDDDLTDRRPLLHADHQHTAVPPDFDIVEIAGSEQIAD